MRADRLLLSRLAPAKPSSELHGCRARTSSSGLVSLPSTRSSSVSSSVTLSLVTTSTGSSRSSWPGLPGCLSLQSRGHNLWGKVEVVTQVLDTLVNEVLVDSNAVLLGHQHPEVLTSLVEVNQAILA